MQDDDGRRAGAGTVGLRHRIRYRFDNLLARGTWAALLLLGVVTLTMVVVSGLLLRLFGVTFTENQDVGWLEDTWQSLLRALDTGTMAGDIGWGRRILSLAVTLFGVLVAGTLIGILAAGVEDTITRMRRGRSVVIESNHVVVLGPPDRVGPVVRELVRSGAATRGGIVVMADDDPADVRNEIRALVDVPRDLTLVIRSGDPTKPQDLELVRLDAARQVVVVAGVDETSSVRTTLALLAATPGSTVPIIVETSDPSTAASLTEAGKPRVQALSTDQALARIGAYAVAHPGLAGVVAELTDPRSADLQVRRVAQLAGTPFRDLVLGAQGSRPIGWITADGALVLNPAPDALLDASDRLIFLAVTDDPPTIARDTARSVAGGDTPPARAMTVEHLLVLGWSPLAELLVESWATIASPGSSLEIVAEPDGLPSDEVLSRVDRIAVTVTAGDIDAVTAAGDPARRPTVILLAAQGDPVESDATDSATILRLIQVRRRLDAVSSDARLMVELIDPDSTALVPQMGADDHVMSREMAAQLTVQLAEEPERRRILGALNTPGRPSLRLVGAADLGLTGDQDIGGVVAACLAVGLVALGWRRAGIVTLDPAPGTVVAFGEGDQIVVID